LEEWQQQRVDDNIASYLTGPESPHISQSKNEPLPLGQVVACRV